MKILKKNSQFFLEVVLIYQQKTLKIFVFIGFICNLHYSW